MSSCVGTGIPFQLPPNGTHASNNMRVSPRSSTSQPSRTRGLKGAESGNVAQVAESEEGRGRRTTQSTRIPVVKTTRTRTVKSRAIFTPDDDVEKKPRVKGPRRPKKSPKKILLEHLLEDEKAEEGLQGKGKDEAIGAGEGQRKRSRNASDGENRWDRIRAKFRSLVQKIRKNKHFLEVYEQDGWKNSGREKLKPSIELQNAKERVHAGKAELRWVLKRLTEMNSGGARWRSLEVDEEGCIEVAGVVCTKCGRGDSDDNDDILLCDYAGCFRAYHQNCLSPPIKPEAFPSEEQDWFCWQCECFLDCLQMLEEEFQDQHFNSWKDVFPEVEAGGDVEAGQEDLLLSEEDSEDDESFKGSSSEEEEEDEEEEERASEEVVVDGKMSPSDHGPGTSLGRSRSVSNGNKGEEDDEERESEDEDLYFMSDAESVGFDEVAKLHMEAGSLVESEDKICDQVNLAEASAGGGDRGSRARSRRRRRAAALGLPEEIDESQEEKQMTMAALAGDGTVDTANILNGRRRRTNVDYVKLNEDMFGDGYREDLDDDKAVSSDGEVSVSSEVSMIEDDPSQKKKSKGRRKNSTPKKSSTPKKRSAPNIDPFTGQPRKRGRPRLYAEGCKTGVKKGKVPDNVGAEETTPATASPGAVGPVLSVSQSADPPPSSCSGAAVLGQSASTGGPAVAIASTSPSSVALPVSVNGATQTTQEQLSKSPGQAALPANGVDGTPSAAGESEFVPFMGLKRRRGRPRKYTDDIIME